MRLRTSCSVLFCFFLTGCGSVMGRTSLADGEIWYPGVKTDFTVIGGDSESDYNFLQGTIWTLDTPLSFIGDTLLLPVDYFHGPWKLSN